MIEGRELALAVLTLRGRAAEAIVVAAAAAGFDSVTLRLIEPRPGDHDHLVADHRARQDLARLMTRHGVGLLDVEVVRLGPDTTVASLAPALDAAAELGARYVLTVCEDPDPDRFTERLVELDGQCATRGMGCVLEFMRFSECRSIEDAVQAVLRARGAGAQRLGVLVDPLHLRRSGGSPAQVAAHATRRPDLFPYVQLCDAPLAPPPGGPAEVRAEAVTSRLLPGEGELPLLPLLAALPARTPVSVETPVRGLEALDEAARAAAAFAACHSLLTGTVPVPH